MRLEPVIGLEIHVQLKTKSKMFCGCSNDSEGLAPNRNICPTCTGQPGTLPNINARAVEMGLLAATALGCKIAGKSKFDRKNYFYPDLPKGYQISQFDLPVAQKGLLRVTLNEGREGEREFSIGITRLHLEEDAAKLQHAGDDASLVDFNRASSPLAEIVTEPDFRSPEEAKAFLQELRLIMRYLGVSDADMEKGQLRCDANISLREIPDDPKNEDWMATLNPKTEIKNLNSFRAVERALHHEIERQTKLWLDGQPPQVQATRGWDEGRGITVEQRTKEESSDYRYFPEPDLPTVDLTEIRELVPAQLPELPAARRNRFIEQYGLTKADARTFCDQPELADLAEQVFSELENWNQDIDEEQKLTPKRSAKLVSGWLLNKLAGVLTAQKVSLADLKTTPENLAELLTLIHTNKVTGTNALVILEKLVLDGGEPTKIMETGSLGSLGDSDELLQTVQQAIADSPQAVTDWQAGKKTAVQYLVGQVMKATRGKAPPEEARKLLEEELNKL